MVGGWISPFCGVLTSFVKPLYASRLRMEIVHPICNANGIDRPPDARASDRRDRVSCDHGRPEYREAAGRRTPLWLYEGCKISPMMVERGKLRVSGPRRCRRTGLTSLEAGQPVVRGVLAKGDGRGPARSRVATVATWGAVIVLTATLPSRRCAHQAASATGDRASSP